jgi:hypothetical protein
MKTTNYFLLKAIILISLFSCNSNAKLNQQMATKAINELISSSNPNENYLRLNSVKDYGTISQFSDNEANSIITIDYSSMHAMSGKSFNGEFQIKCIFKKNVDNKWFLTSIEPITQFGDWPGFYKWVRRNQNLTIPAH